MTLIYHLNYSLMQTTILKEAGSFDSTSMYQYILP